MFGPMFPQSFIESIIQSKKPDQYINFRAALKTWNLQNNTHIQYQSFIRWIMVMQKRFYLKGFAKNTYRVLRPLPPLHEVVQMEHELLLP